MYELQDGKYLTQYEKRYLKIGIWLILLSPIQFFLLFELIIMTDADIVFLIPFLWFIGYAITSGVTFTATLYAIAGSFKLAKEVNDTLGICSMGVFSFHAGCIMVSRIIFVSIVRRWSGNRKFRLNYPYILWE